MHQIVHVSKILPHPYSPNEILYFRFIKMFNLVRKKSSPEQQQHTDQQISAAKRFWNEQLALAPNHHQPIESNIENISSNINRLDSERFLAVVTAAAQQKLHQQFYSSDDSNDESLIIDQQH